MCKGSIPFIWFDFIRSRTFSSLASTKQKRKRWKETAKVNNYELTIAGTYTDDKKLMKEVTKVVETETLKPVSIVSTEVIEKLYAMDEQKFIEMAEVLPPRGKQEDTNEEEE